MLMEAQSHQGGSRYEGEADQAESDVLVWHMASSASQIHISMRMIKWAEHVSEVEVVGRKLREEKILLTSSPTEAWH